MKNKYDITEADIREKLDQICVEYEKNHPVDRAKSSRKYIILISVALMVIGAALVVRMFIKQKNRPVFTQYNLSVFLNTKNLPASYFYIWWQGSDFSTFASFLRW